ncbi:MAG: dTMP kinase [Euryarchaeota archaeon]|nr:dTMP kinase [Euryarchaeota archaeon]
MKGRLITLEGIDGSGKSTIVDFLRSHPSLPGTIFTREPTGSWIGEAVEKAIHSQTDPLAELMLFTADHAEHIATTIRPGIEAGKLVISDRYSDSRIAYQGVTLRSVLDDPFAWIQDLHRGWSIEPDMTILLDIDPEVAVKRCGERGEQTKFETIEFLKGVRANFLRLAEAEPQRFAIIDVDRPLEEITADVIDVVTLVDRERR